MNDKSNTAFDVSNIDPGNRNGKIKLFKANNFENHNRFGPSHQNGMNQANLFISKLNAPLETPALLLSKAKLELKQEIDKEEFLEHSQSSLNKEIKLLSSEIVKLERKKLKLKLAKHNDESVRLSEDSESDRGSEHRSQSSNSSRENARNKNNQLNSTIKTENAKRKESFGKTLTKNNISKLSNQSKNWSLYNF